MRLLYIPQTTPRMQKTLFVLGCLMLIGCQTAPPPTIVLDGQFEDWEAFPVLLDDPMDAGATEMDFRTIKVSYDDDWVYFYVDMRHVNDLSYLEGTAFLLLDVDGNPATGQQQYGFDGVDARVQFSAYNAFARRKMGLAMQVATTQSDSLERRSFYDIGFEKIPSYASSIYEMRVRRHAQIDGIPPVLTGASFGVKFVHEDAEGTLLDETGVAWVAFEETLASMPPHVEYALAKRNPAAIRFTLLNASVRRIFDDREPYQRIVRALNPDIIAITEVMRDTTTEAFQAYFAETLGGSPDDWHVAYPDPGGFLKRPIISRYPLDSVPLFDHFTHMEGIRDTLAARGYTTLSPRVEGYLSRPMPVTGKIVRIEGQRILIMALGLIFSGGADSAQEVIRQLEGRRINQAIKSLMDSGAIDGVIAGTDLNLYGTQYPLLNMIEGADIDKTDLAIAPAVHLDGKSTFTWFSPFKDTFVPAVLDHLLYSDSIVKREQSFLVDTAVLPETVLKTYGLEAGDLEASMDHYPLVFDFWIDE